jgi:PiT family inorganic phosphate transporter
LVGAGILLESTSVEWAALLPKVVQPLLLSVFVAYALSVALASLALRRTRVRHDGAPGISQATTATRETKTSTTATRETKTSTTPHAANTADRVLGAAHWLTSGLACFARGLNDTPKIVAVGAFALVPAGWATWQILLVVTTAMAVGSIIGGLRVTEKLAKDVVKMSHREGFTANLTTATLVGLGAAAGLPMSTTHVSTGAIAGSAGTDVSRINGKTIGNFAIAWVITPPFAGAVAAITFLLLR